MFAPECVCVCVCLHLAVQEHQSVSAECWTAKWDWFVFHFGLEGPDRRSNSADAEFMLPQNKISLEKQHLIKSLWSTTFYILTFFPDICLRFNVSLNGNHHNYYLIEFVFSMVRHFQELKTKFSHDSGPKSKIYNITPQKEACCLSFMLLNKKKRETIMLASIKTRQPLTSALQQGFMVPDHIILIRGAGTSLRLVSCGDLI